MMAFNRHLLFQGLIFRFHVKLQGFAIKHDIIISWQLFRQQNIMRLSYSGIGCLIVRIWSQSILKIKQRALMALCVTWTNKLFDWHLFVIKAKMTGKVYDRSQYIVRQCFVVVCCDFWFFLPGRNLTPYAPIIWLPCLCCVCWKLSITILYPIGSMYGIFPIHLP